MKKSYLYLAAAMALASCANDDYVGGENLASNDTTPIAFNMNTPATTRADQDGATAANTLGQEFIVWGEKNEETNKATDAANLVFENYRVQYADKTGSTKNSTVSNTTGWDYVGIAPYAANVTPKINAATQTVKYWDFKATNYVFTAVSALKTDIEAGNVKITKTEGAASVASSAKGYKIELTNGAKAENVFVADRNEVTTPKTSTDVKPVTMRFRNFQTKIRFGFYETVPGYNVQITGVKYNSATTAVSDKFGVDGDFVKAPTGSDKVTYTVTYDTNNVPVVTVATEGTSATAKYAEFGTNVFNKDLGKESTACVYDNADNSYTCILPNTSNSTAMTFKVSYKLISEDTKEEIVVEDKQVTVPSQYCQWKPNFAYTYLFKISDSSADLYPITFDAVVEADEISKQETITEVGEPSITTYAIVSADDKTVVTGKDEYETGNVIYAVTNAAAGMTSSNTKLYTVVPTKGAKATVVPDVTEASVKNCIEHGVENTQNKTWTVTDVNESTLVATNITDNTSNFATSVPNEDGIGTRAINALTWTDKNTVAGTYYYAVEYTVSDVKYYKIVKVVKQ